MGTKTTQSTPMMALEATACPDGNDWFVSITRRYSSGGRTLPTTGLATTTSSPAPAATTATNAASPRRPRMTRSTTTTAAITAIATVLPTVVIATAILV